MSTAANMPRNRVDDEGLNNNNNNSSAKRPRLSAVGSGAHPNTSSLTISNISNAVTAYTQVLDHSSLVTQQQQHQQMAVEKQQHLRKAIRSLWEESRLYKETRDAQEAAVRKSSYFTASQKKPAVSLTSFKVANKWRLLVDDLLTLPEDMIEEEVLSLFSKMLYAHHCFFRSDLGECSELSKNFFDVQMVRYDLTSYVVCVVVL